MHPYCIDRRFEAGGAGRHGHLRPGMLQLALAPRPLPVHVERVVAGAERHALHPRAGGGDGPRVGHPLSGLDDRDDVDASERQAALTLEGAHQPVEGHDLLAALGHRQDDAVESGTGHCHCIAITKLGVEGVDPNVGTAFARSLQSLNHERTGRDLFRPGDRIFQIEDHMVGAAVEDFLDFPRMVAGGKEKAAVCGHVSSTSSPAS